jgi:hypothetical protein
MLREQSLNECTVPNTVYIYVIIYIYTWWLQQIQLAKGCHYSFYAPQSITEAIQYKQLVASCRDAPRFIHWWADPKAIYRCAHKSLAIPDWKKKLKDRHFSFYVEVIAAVETW